MGSVEAGLPYAVNTSPCFCCKSLFKQWINKPPSLAVVIAKVFSPVVFGLKSRPELDVTSRQWALRVS